MSDDIKVLKLVTGEEIIGIRGLGYLKNPLMIAIIPNDNGGYSNTLVPWIHMEQDKNIFISENSIICEGNPEKELLDLYLKVLERMTGVIRSATPEERNIILS